MVTPAAGSVVLVPFPFSDLSQSKLRPAVELTDQDFEHGSLRVVSHARPAKLFTAHQGLFVAEAGSLKSAALERIINTTVSLLQRPC
jgi:mRNA interferase MazF